MTVTDAAFGGAGVVEGAAVVGVGDTGAAVGATVGGAVEGAAVVGLGVTGAVVGAKVGGAVEGAAVVGVGVDKFDEAPPPTVR